MERPRLHTLMNAASNYHWRRNSSAQESCPSMQITRTKIPSTSGVRGLRHDIFAPSKFTGCSIGVCKLNSPTLFVNISCMGIGAHALLDNPTSRLVGEADGAVVLRLDALL
mmetsp:Transcript_35335/g.58534  ORF Transcript_35335/g.58534 Transcript_35335/m.58534 type:complete len:111 (-) Transcript_35335:1750-2082(-)